MAPVYQPMIPRIREGREEKEGIVSSMGVHKYGLSIELPSKVKSEACALIKSVVSVA